MKTVNFTFALLLSLFALTSCSKKADDAVNPDLPSRVTGNYKLTGLRSNGTMRTLKSTITGSMSVVRESATSVQVSIDVLTGDAANDVHFMAAGVAVMDAGNNEVNLISDGSVLAKGGNNTIAFTSKPVDGSAPFDFIGTK